MAKDDNRQGVNLPREKEQKEYAQIQNHIFITDTANQLQNVNFIRKGDLNEEESNEKIFMYAVGGTFLHYKHTT